jgi:hypothetical protein
MSAGEARRFLRVFALTLAGALLVALAVTTVADPKRYWGIDLVPADPSDPRPLKLEALQRAQPFETLILGDSRGQRLEPDHVRRRTGRTAFNASITGGRLDAFEYVLDEVLRRHGGTLRSALLLVGPEALIDDNPLLPNLVEKLRKSMTSEVLTLAVQGILDGLSLRERPTVWRYSADGHETFTTAWDFAEVARNGGPSEVALDNTIAVFRKAWRDAAKAPPDRLDRILGKLNARGIAPLIVTPPYHPHTYRSGGRLLQRARRHFDAVLRELASRRDFEFVDLGAPGSVDIALSGFADGVHMNEANMRAVLDRALRESRDAL